MIWDSDETSMELKSGDSSVTVVSGTVKVINPPDSGKIVVKLIKGPSVLKGVKDPTKGQAPAAPIKSVYIKTSKDRIVYINVDGTKEGWRLIN